MSLRPALVLCAASFVSFACAAAAPASSDLPASPSPAAADALADVEVPYLDPTELDAPARVADPFDAPTDDEPRIVEGAEERATDAAVALVSSLDDWGAIEGAYAETLECFHHDTEITLDELERRSEQPFGSEHALGWSTIASIQPVAVTDSAVALVVRGAASTEGDLTESLDERMVIVRDLGDSWKIVAELDRDSQCFSALWATVPVDPFYVTCANIGRMCTAAIDEQGACGGMGCACNSCLMQQESCADKALSCLTGDTAGAGDELTASADPRTPGSRNG